LRWLRASGRPALEPVLRRLLQLDAWICPRYGEAEEFEVAADFDLAAVLDSLDAMRAPLETSFDGMARQFRLRSPGGLGVVLRSPDGGHWLQARVVVGESPDVVPLRSLTGARPIVEVTVPGTG
jgi:hypothetical protein